MSMLIARGIPADVTDRYGRLAHNHAVINGQMEAVEYLLTLAEIKIDAVDNYGGTALHWAAVQFFQTHFFGFAILVAVF